MRYIDRTCCEGPFGKGKDMEIKNLGKLTRAATKIAEEKRLAVMKSYRGHYRIISECGLGAGIEDFFYSLEEVDSYLKKLK